MKLSSASATANSLDGPEKGLGDVYALDWRTVKYVELKFIATVGFGVC